MAATPQGKSSEADRPSEVPASAKPSVTPGNVNHPQGPPTEPPTEVPSESTKDVAKVSTEETKPYEPERVMQTKDSHVSQAKTSS